MQIEIIDGKLYQWDTGRKVRLTPDADESITEVHFGCQCDPEALVVAPEIGEEIAVCIPPEPLQKSGWLQVYVMTATDTPGKRTAYHVAEPIFARPKPVDYVFTPTERLTWESLDKRVAALEAGGGGGGDGDSGVLYVTLTQNPTIPTFYTPSHTCAEILEAHESGKYVFTTIEETDNDGRSASVVLSLSMCNEEAAMFEAISVMDSNTVSVIVAGDMAMYAYSSTVLSGATADQNGHQGDVPAPAAGQQDMVLHGDGTWRAVESGGGSGGEGAGLWEHICDITVTEETSSVEINQNSAGVPFTELRYNEFWVLAKMVGASTNTGTWWIVYGSTDDNRRIQAAVSGGTTGIKYATWYLFIRGGKKYFNDGGINDPYCVRSGDQAWLDNFLDYYNSDHYVSLTIGGGTIGVDTEIRILGRRA